MFFLACVIVAGVYGAATVSRRILVVQAVPAAIALAVVLARRRRPAEATRRLLAGPAARAVAGASATRATTRR